MQSSSTDQPPTLRRPSSGSGRGSAAAGRGQRQRQPGKRASYTRRASNDLAASVRLDELRQLQSQLGMLIQNAKEDAVSMADDDEEAAWDDDASGSATLHRGSELTAGSNASSWDPRRTSEGEHNWDPRRNSIAENEGEGDDAEQASLLDDQGNGNSSGGDGNVSDCESIDIEAGLDNSTSAPTIANLAYKPRRTLQPDFDPMSSEATLPVTHRTGVAPLVTAGASGILSSTTHSDITDDHNEHRSTIGSAAGSDVTDTTAATTGSKQSKAASSLRRARDVLRGGKQRSRSSSRGHTSIFKKKNRKDSGGLDDSTVSSSTRSRRNRLLPNYDFLQKEDAEEDKEKQSLMAGSTRWWHGVFLFSIISMVACVITLWAPYPIGARMPTDQIATMPWSDGCQGGLQTCICPRETICADDLLSMIFLTIARCTAWFDYPLYMLLFMSKANNLNNFLQKTALRCWINFSDYHRVHSLFGIIVGIESTSHAFFHVLRWARRKDDFQLLWTTRTGITGMIAIIITPLIVLPMTVPYLKQRMRFERRKALHYLSILWGVALMCHAPQRIFWLIGAPVFIYTADKVVEGLFKTHLVESAHFQRLGDTSCLVSFPNPPNFGKQNSAYVYLMLPWLSKYQFHAFTVFPSTKKDHSSICIHKCGDWTGKLMSTITIPTHKPAFVVGPFLSPFSSPAMDSENLVAVASGIGVTPAISLIKQYSSTSRRLNLVWICRDAGLVEHFLQNVEFGSDGYTLIYYTGKDRSLILKDDLPPNVFMFNGRPNLERAISGIISSIATGEGLPEELSKKVLTRTPAEMRSKLLLEKAMSIYKMDQLFDYTVKASNHYNEGLEPLVDTVNYQGVLSTMRHLLGSDDCERVTDQITQNFEKVDTDGYCRIGFHEFKTFFDLMLRGSSNAEDSMSRSMQNVKRGLQRMDTVRDMFAAGRKCSDLSSKDEFGIRKHLQGEGKFAARNWNMLYCGGSQPVLDQLKAYKRKFGVGLSTEKFDW